MRLIIRENKSLSFEYGCGYESLEWLTEEQQKEYSSIELRLREQALREQVENRLPYAKLVDRLLKLSLLLNYSEKKATMIMPRELFGEFERIMSECREAYDKFRNVFPAPNNEIRLNMLDHGQIIFAYKNQNNHILSNICSYLFKHYKKHKSQSTIRFFIPEKIS